MSIPRLLSSLLVAGAFLQAAVTSQAFTNVVASWNFNEGPSVSGAVATAETLQVSRGSGTMTFVGEAPQNVVVFAGTVTNMLEGDVRGNALAIQNGTGGANNGSYLEMAIDTTGRNDVDLSFTAQRTSTGFNEIHISYSLGGADFVPVTVISDIPTSFGTTTAVPTAIRVVDFNGAIDNNANVRVRMRFEGGSTTGATGNNRIDNLHFTYAGLPPDGAGTAVVRNVSPINSYNNNRVFEDGVLQRLEVTVTGVAPANIASVSVTVPDSWSAPTSGNVSLSGSGFSGASASVSGRTVTVTGAAVNDFATGIVTIDNLLTPGLEQIPGVGSMPITVRTAMSGGTLTNIATQPAALFVVPIERVRPVDAQGRPVALNQPVAIEGVAILDSHLFNSGANPRFTTYLQDETAGVAIDALNMWVYDLVFTGNRYLAIGTVSQFNGLTQISLSSPADVQFLETATAPEPLVRSISQLLADPERYEGMLVRISYLSRAAASPDWPPHNPGGTPQNPPLGYASIPVTDGVGELILYINQFTDLPNQSGQDNEPNWPVDVVGIFNQFDSNAPFTSGYQILPRSLADFHPATEPPPALGFAAWQQAQFGANAGNPLIAGPLADPDGDGVPNLLEYALGGSVSADSTHLLPDGAVQAGSLAISFRRARDANDITYRVQASADLVGWTEIWTSAQAPYTSTEEYAVQVVSDTAAVAGAPRRFLRLVVTQN